MYRVKENGKIETATILERVSFNFYSTTYRTKYHTIIHYPLPNKFEDSENSIAFFETKKEALKEYKKNIKEQGNKMKKIETWEDLKKAFENNMLISFEYVVDYGECIIFDNVIGFDKEGYLIRYENINEAGAKIWRYCGIGKKSYQQIHDIIKLMLE